MNDQHFAAVQQAVHAEAAASNVDVCAIWVGVKPLLQNLATALQTTRPVLARLMNLVIEGMALVCPS